MHLGRVIGSCVATHKADGLTGHRMLIVQPLDFDLADNGVVTVAVDTVQADHGELVLVVRSREAANSLANNFAPVDAAIVGIVDDLGMVAVDGSDRLAWLSDGARR